MKKIVQRRVFNIILLLGIYLILLSSFLDNTPSFQRGAARGTAIAIPIILVIIVASTIYYTKKAGGSAKAAKQNIKRNLLNFVSFKFKD